MGVLNERTETESHRARETGAETAAGSDRREPMTVRGIETLHDVKECLLE